MKKTALTLLLIAALLTACSCGAEDAEKSGFSIDGTVTYEAISEAEHNTVPDTAQSQTDTQTEAQTDVQTDTPSAPETDFADGEEIYLDSSWRFADFSAINSGCAVFYKAKSNRKNITVAVNAGHGTEGGKSVKTYCHPDKTPKVTGGTTAEGAIQAVAVSTGMAFNDGAYERDVNLAVAQCLRDMLLDSGFDVVMIRDGSDVQLDNVARTVIANNTADCHIAIHFDGDSLDYDKGAFYIAVPDGIKYLDNVASHWEKSEKLGEALISALRSDGRPIRGEGYSDIDLTQTSYSEIPSVDIELGNQCTDHSDSEINKMCSALTEGIVGYFKG